MDENTKYGTLKKVEFPLKLEDLCHLLIIDKLKIDLHPMRDGDICNCCGRPKYDLRKNPLMTHESVKKKEL